MNRLHALAVVAALALTAGACARAKLSVAGSQVKADPNFDASGCKHMGQVTGKGGGSGGGAWLSDDKLVEYAMNDVRNKAAKRGATHVLPSQAAMTSNQSGATVAATIIGQIYSCPEGYRPGGGGGAPAASGPPAASTAPAAGTERGACYGNGTCNTGLTCASNVCVKVPAETAPKTIQTGTVGGPCYGNQTCNRGLKCEQGMCVTSGNAP